MTKFTILFCLITLVIVHSVQSTILQAKLIALNRPIQTAQIHVKNEIAENTATAVQEGIGAAKSAGLALKSIALAPVSLVKKVIATKAKAIKTAKVLQALKAIKIAKALLQVNKLLLSHAKSNSNDKFDIISKLLTLKIPAVKDIHSHKSAFVTLEEEIPEKVTEEIIKVHEEHPPHNYVPHEEIDHHHSKIVFEPTSSISLKPSHEHSDHTISDINSYETYSGPPSPQTYHLHH